MYIFLHFKQFRIEIHNKTKYVCNCIVIYELKHYLNLPALHLVLVLLSLLFEPEDHKIISGTYPSEGEERKKRKMVELYIYGPI